jgi:hypothetical protein
MFTVAWNTKPLELLEAAIEPQQGYKLIKTLESESASRNPELGPAPPTDMETAQNERALC